ncbi:hypothetical protein ACSMX9_08180 [Streptomyces sp. LE64]|uniref:hypothetical protein n=1 Tax=Streptomyces sp. LE64 TaxID=3448653 RepID=UPI00404223F7
MTEAPEGEITPAVERLRRHSRLRRTGPAPAPGLGVDGIHVWTFAQVGGGVRVSTEETRTGTRAEADVPLATGVLPRTGRPATRTGGRGRGP